MDSITKINLETEELCLKTLEILNKDSESLQNSMKNLNKINNNINISNTILDNINSLNNRIFNYFSNKKIVENDSKDEKKEKIPNQKKHVELQTQNTIHNQLNNIKKLSIVINKELDYQNEMLDEITNLSISSNNKINKANNKF